MLNILSGIKEYDVLFKDKIKVLETNFMNKKEIDDKVIGDKKLIEKYILDIKEFRQYTWQEKLEMVKQYIDENGKRPSKHDKDKEIKQLGYWIGTQQQNYKKKTEIMKEDKIYTEWTNFTNEYLLSNEESWYNNLNKVKEYIDKNKKKPSKHVKDKEIKLLGSWIGTQQAYYKNKKDIMKEDKIYTEWTNFTNEYQEYFLEKYFLSNEEIWYNNLIKIKEYIDENKKKPSETDKDKEIKQLGYWIGTQQTNYKKKEHNMKEDKIYTEWTNFTNEYQEYFLKKYLLSNEESWYNNLNKVKEYIDKNKKKPSKYDKDKEIKQLGSWIGNQQKNYKKKNDIMKEDKIYTEWTNFTNEYQISLLSNEELWYNNLNKVKEYIDNNKKRPSKHDKDKEIKQLGCWISNQQNNLKKKEHRMKNEEIYTEFTNFMNEYEKYFN
jgi:hypothetical protein